MFYDYLLLVSITSNILSWAYKDWIRPKDTATLMLAAIMGIGALRVFGSTAFHNRARYKKALFAALSFAVNLAQNDPYSLLILIAFAFLVAAIPFGLYIMISSSFATARDQPREHSNKVARMGIGFLIVAILLIAAAPYLETVAPKWNPPEAFFKPSFPRTPITSECPGLRRQIVLGDQWISINPGNRCSLIWSPPTEGTVLIGEPHNYYTHAAGQMSFHGSGVRTIYAKAQFGRAQLEYQLCPPGARNC